MTRCPLEPGDGRVFSAAQPAPVVTAVIVVSHQASVSLGVRRGRHEGYQEVELSRVHERRQFAGVGPNHPLTEQLNRREVWSDWCLTVNGCTHNSRCTGTRASAFETYISLLPALTVSQSHQCLVIVPVAGVTVLQKSHRTLYGKGKITKLNLRSLTM